MSIAEAISPALPLQGHTEVVTQADQARSQNRLANALQANVDIDVDGLRSKTVMDGNGFMRVRHTGAVAIDGYKYAVRITEPALVYTTPEESVVGMLPGFLQDPSRGNAKNLHNDVSTMYPERRIIGVSSDGYHKDGTPLTLWNIGTRFEEMAEGRLKLFRQIAGDSKTMLKGLSKGSVLGLLMAEANIEREYIDLEASVYHSPALVPTERVIQDMVVRFGGGVVLGGVKQAARHPITMFKSLYLPSLWVLPAYACDVYNLLHGKKEAEIDEVAAATRLGVIAPEDDSLAQLPMWRRIQYRHPDNVHLMVKAHEDHTTSVDSLAAARDIKSVHGQLLARQALASA